MEQGPGVRCMTYLYLIALGSNLGDRTANLLIAIENIKNLLGPVVSQSSFYHTDPVGNADQEFLNAAVICKSNIHPEVIMPLLLDIESKLGRQRTIHWGNRTIDLDIIAIQDENGSPIEKHSPTLQIPHPRAHQREFVMEPCAEIAPKWKIADKTLSEWRDALSAARPG